VVKSAFKQLDNISKKVSTVVFNHGIEVLIKLLIVRVSLDSA